MRHGEPGGTDAPAAVGQQVEVQRARRVAVGPLAPGLQFERLLLAPEGLALRSRIADAVAVIACGGALNGLAQTLLRMTVPGVPDLYQGNEFWDFSLVDPDNRRPVDYAAREHALQEPLPPVELLANWRDGRIKQAMIAQVLERRRACPELFHHGQYLPLEVRGKHAGHVLAFARIGEAQRAVVVVPRLAATRS